MSIYGMGTGLSWGVPGPFLSLGSPWMPFSHEVGWVGAGNP